MRLIDPTDLPYTVIYSTNFSYGGVHIANGFTQPICWSTSMVGTLIGAWTQRLNATSATNNPWQSSFWHLKVLLKRFSKIISLRIVKARAPHEGQWVVKLFGLRFCVITSVSLKDIKRKWQHHLFCSPAPRLNWSGKKKPDKFPLHSR